MKLKVSNHSRDAVGMTYVYPVVSRRARGVSIGINLNPNNACNYRCIYCQVPDLQLGKAPEIDLALLETELRTMLEDVLHGDFMERSVPEESRRLNDIALSGNGEPTSSPQFKEVMDLVARVIAAFGLEKRIDVVLITNGTLLDRPKVQAGIRRLNDLGGQVWFKLDSATDAGTARINNTEGRLSARLERLVAVAASCKTFLQTCVFELDGEPPSEQEQDAYISLLRLLVQEQVPLGGVLLYGLARPSMQPEKSRLGRVSEAWMTAYAQRIRALGVSVTITP